MGAPLLTGLLLVTLLALALGAPARPLLLWMLASVVSWGAVLTGAAALGFSMLGLWRTSENPLSAEFGERVNQSLRRIGRPGPSG